MSRRGQSRLTGHCLLADRTCECGQKPPTNYYVPFNRWRAQHLVDVRMELMEKEERRRWGG